MNSDQLEKAVLIAAGALVLGALGPWATVFGISKTGIEGDGLITLIGGLLAVGAIRFWSKPTVALVLAVLVALIAIYDFIDITGTDVVSVGWGLYLSLLGAGLLTYATYQLRRGVSG